MGLDVVDSNATYICDHLGDFLINPNKTQRDYLWYNYIIDDIARKISYIDERKRIQALKDLKVYTVCNTTSPLFFIRKNPIYKYSVIKDFVNAFKLSINISKEVGNDIRKMIRVSVNDM